MIRKLCLIVVAGLLPFALTGCGSKDGKAEPSASVNESPIPDGSKQSANPQEAVKLSVLNISEYADTPEYKTFIERFQQKFPNIKIDTISVPHEQYINKRNIMLASGSAVDLIWGNGVDQFDALNKGFLMPLDDAAKEAGIDMSKDFGNVAPEKGGQHYRFPIQQNNWMVFYNKKVFDDAKVAYPNPKVPMTWEEYATLAEKLTNQESSKNKIYGMFYNNWGMYYYGYGSQLTNGKFYTPNGLSNINAPEFKRSMEWMNDVINVKKAAMPVSEYISNNTDFLSFWNGNYGMVVGAQWYAQLAATKKDKFPRDWKAGIAPMPVPAEMAGKHMNWSNIDSLAVPKNSKHAKEAMVFAKEYVADYTLSTGTLPMYNKINAKSYFQGLADRLKDDGITFEQVEYLFGGDPNVMNVEEQPTQGAPAEYEAILRDQITQYFTGKTKIDDLLKNVKQDIDKVIQEQKK
ncbi:ABC transporter substrate-binding protein [Paenibacillus alba]|uniref:Extracellular solute-binding protein n=1 Tax=Paenibacillus alba TaxID=1197127 RepID=A0ABU6G7C7_9BACL|nr:extracellular solute-binding protein [Paenibacillus alba]MEC0230066.1 extracellular solute-binding protein [Paenibacillus alba]